LADLDVFIAGAGPAGCAAAISLARFAPELRVGLADAHQPGALRVGEGLPPPIKPILQHLGLWHRFGADGHCASYRTLSAWGDARLGSNEFLLQPDQVGWRLDRDRFDAMMLEAAAQRATLYLAARVTGLTRADDSVDGSWRIACGDGTIHAARVVVDATGRAAELARLHGLRPSRIDKLVGCFVHFAGDADDDQELTLEAFADGWWYAAAIPGARRVVACMTDTDLVRRLGIGRIEHFMRALDATHHVGRAALTLRPLGPPRLRPAGSQILMGPAPRSLICVGDAASCFDPISAQGIVKALRSGIFASYAVADWLIRADDSGIRRYRALVQEEFAAYRRTLSDYYAIEHRWSGRPFWRRRHGEGAVMPSRTRTVSVPAD
jgi:flavin-dependent dehydrogenase